LTLPRKNLLHARLIPNQVDYAEFCDFVAVPGLVGGTCFTGSLVIRNTLMKSEFIAYNADKWQIPRQLLAILAVNGKRGDIRGARLKAFFLVTERMQPQTPAATPVERGWALRGPASRWRGTRRWRSPAR
jgi:hypothetical protein